MKILVVDDHPLYRSGVAFTLQNSGMAVEVVECSSLAVAFQRLDEGLVADLMILDLQMPGYQGVDSVRAVRTRRPEVPVLVLSGTEDPAVVRECIDLGAFGFLPKSAPADHFNAALARVLAGGVYLPPTSLSVAAPVTRAQQDAWGRLGARLTERQRQVLLGIVQGKPNKVIARDLGLSDTTVKSHVAHILEALVVSNRTEAVYALARAGLSLQDLQASASDPAS
ncbi:response regulator transcription factor [Ramlibacter ginsenosidimutans]|uniref:Response regulator transcription factor n=1 Tax=Ramlibacter ginsenosidimutans TaxID=502333 RepID=A0A934TXU2_9BURK|nr:response regulator transcription factor [Ramlibacter ginsenosidimutans]MBK6009480.1 response regulator transcription factor [Ramlibacter ginsenosidimutans]